MEATPTILPDSLPANIRGDGPRFVRLGSRSVGYDIMDLDAWLDARKVVSTSERLLTR